MRKRTALLVGAIAFANIPAYAASPEMDLEMQLIRKLFEFEDGGEVIPDGASTWACQDRVPYDSYIVRDRNHFDLTIERIRGSFTATAVVSRGSGLHKKNRYFVPKVKFFRSESGFGALGLVDTWVSRGLTEIVPTGFYGFRSRLEIRTVPATKSAELAFPVEGSTANPELIIEIASTEAALELGLSEPIQDLEGRMRKMEEEFGENAANHIPYPDYVRIVKALREYIREFGGSVKSIANPNWLAYSYYVCIKRPS